MKNLIRLIIASSLLFAASSYAQNSPTIGTVTSNIIEKGTGDNYIIVGNVTDGDALAVQNLTVTAVSSNNAVLSVTGVLYTQGQSFAIIKVREFGIDGTATINFSVQDPDGTTPKSFVINVGFFYTQGCKWSIYDIVFWQNAFPPDNEITKLDSIIPRVELPTNIEIWRNLGMTAGPIQLGGIFTFHDGYTTGYRGTIIPTATGIYMFTLDYQDGGEFRISSSASYKDVFQIGGFRKRSEGSPQVITDTVYLVAGKPYGYKCAYWTVFSEQFALRWAYLGANPTNVTTVTSAAMPTNVGGTTFLTNTPLGINMFIPGFYAKTTSAGPINFLTLGAGGALATYPYYDLMKPVSVSGLTLLRKGNDKMEFKWNASFDSIGVKKYNVYVDGVLRFSTKDDKQLSYVLTGLNPSTSYAIFVTAIDNAGNESNISNVLFDTTFPNDAIAPSAPNGLTVDVLADMSAKVSWSPATDNASGIYGYKVYVDGSAVPYNTDTANVTSMVLKTFDPLSSHTFTVQALDGNFNASALSTALGFTTVAYDPLLTSPGVKKLRMNISKEYVGKIDGFGLNASYDNYTTTYVNNVKRINPGLVRWGTLDPNRYSYNESSVGTRTYAKFVDFANKVDAAVAISIGTDATPLIDWRNESIVGVDFAGTVKQMTIMERTAQQMIAYLFAPDSMATKSVLGANFFPYHADVRKRLNEGFRQSTFTGTSSAFKGLIVEFGNEVWGGTSLGASGEVDHNADGFGNYTTYGLWARKMARAFKSSPYYDSTKIKLTYSMREPQPGNSFGLTEAILATNSDPLDVDLGDLLAPAGYMGGNLNYSPGVPAANSELGYYRNSLEYMFRNLNGFYATKNLDNTFRKKQRGFFLYESAMTKSTYNQRMGQAIVLSDYLLTAHKAGSYYPGLFSYEGGEWGITSNDFAVLNPMFKATLLINNVTKGNKDVLNTSVTTFERSINDLGTPIGVGSNYLDPVSTNIFHKNGVYSLILISRDFDADFQVQLSFPTGMLLTPTVSGVSKYMFNTTGDFSSLQSSVSTSSTTISNNMIVTVPKYSMIVFTFNGEVLPANNQQLGFSTYRLPTGFNVTVDNPSNANSLSVTEQFGSISFNATVTGGVAATTVVGWKITKPDSVTSLDIVYLDEKTLRFNANDCRSNGVVTVTSFLRENPNASYTFVVTISGQLSDGVLTQEQCPKFNTLTGVNTKKYTSDFKLYPNPTNGNVLNIESDNTGNFVITNMQGLVVFNKTVNSKFETFNISLDSGLYFATFTNSKGSITKKIVITK